ncbi:hypothetical protein GCM10008174_21360 [Methylopila turkensis]|uniref:Uncharacterized protein n=1 Tax=Methylopila turkensis TaxID=1437816 RepID=A0A9W6N7G5_9HYPH|nr:hypothetical protein GCM10008174_21360 [Methylopila turkensis]
MTPFQNPMTIHGSDATKQTNIAISGIDQPSTFITVQNATVKAADVPSTSVAIVRRRKNRPSVDCVPVGVTPLNVLRRSEAGTGATGELSIVELMSRFRWAGAARLPRRAAALYHAAWRPFRAPMD